jgi:protein-S-isoprenylcysteine O-methyltransferase Ste14
LAPFFAGVDNFLTGRIGQRVSRWAGLLRTLVLAVGIIAMVVIPREERFLECNFNDQYSSYKTRVRRWL